jgi:multiple antibiotic resistance protein
MQETTSTYPFAYIFVIFFLTLGPLKVIPIFNRLCYKTSPSFAKKLAFKATILSSIILFAVAIVGKGILSKWQVSTAALFVAGGLLILIASLQMLSNFTLPKPLPPKTEGYTEEQIPALVINPLTIPAIITPYGIVAILVSTSQSEGDIKRQLTIFVLLFVVIILNWLGMIFAQVIVQKVNIITLLIVGWVFAVLQAGLAIDLMIEGLKRAKIAIL